MYTITNENFSQSADKATAESIIEMIIENNSDWGTDYTEEDFEVTAEQIKCRGEVIAQAIPSFKITAIAPTSYQFSSMLSFGMPYINSYGRFIASLEFDTEEEAKDYLRDRAEMYFEDEQDLNDAIYEINKYGILTLDAVTATIESNEE
jgi:hypothetical protein